MAEAGSPKKLPLDALWRARTSKFGDFAGYDMPLQFEGLIPEHNWTRAACGPVRCLAHGAELLCFAEGPWA
jgi:aminomethyltransferase